MHLDLLLLRSNEQLLFFRLVLFLSFFVVSVGPFGCFCGFFVINRDSDLSFTTGFSNFSLAKDNAVLLLVRKVVLLAFVVKSKVVSFAIHGTLALDILLRDIDPIAHAALHDSLEK